MTKKVIGLQASVTPGRVAAGAAATVRCTARYSDETTAELAITSESVTVSPEPASGWLDGNTIRIGRPGSYDLTCKFEGLSSPALAFTVLVGEPARTFARLDDPEIASGASTTARCRVEDSSGNELTGLAATFSSSPLDGVTIVGDRVTGTRMGDYAISCSVGGRVEKTPAPLTVGPGAPARVVAHPAAYSTGAGEPVGVTCAVLDAAGNAVQTDTHLVVTPAPTSVDAASFTANTLGDYDVTCATASLTSDPVSIHVAPGLPAHLEITSLTPEKAIYVAHDVVQVAARMTDAFGNENTTASWAITSTPTTAATFAGLNRVELHGDSTIQLIVRVTSATKDGAEVADSRSLEVDSTAPEIVIDSPARGQMVQGTGTTIAVSGHVVDTGSGAASVSLNTVSVPVDASGHFQATIPASWGINLIQGMVSDRAGNTSTFAQSFEYAARYVRAGPSHVDTGKVTSGVVLHLGQAVLDDGAPDPDDLATLARLAIQRMDITSLLPHPATTYQSACDLWVTTIHGSLGLVVDSVTFDTPVLDFTAINGGLHLHAELPNLRLAIHTEGDVCDVGVWVSGTAAMDRAVIDGDLTVSRQGTTFAVSMQRPSVNIQNLEIDLALPAMIDWAIDGIISLFSGAITSLLESTLEGQIRSQVPPVVRDFLSSISMGTGFDIPPPLPLHVDLAATPGAVNFHPGGGTVGFDTTVYATGTISPEPLGGILQDSLTPPAFTDSQPLGAAISFDLANQAFYSAWYAGALDLDLSSMVPPITLPGSTQAISVTAHAHALLPPVLTVSSDPAYPVELQVGDLQLDVTAGGVPNVPSLALRIYASAFATATVGVDPTGALSLTVSQSPTIALDLTGGVAGYLDLASVEPQLQAAIQSFLPVLLDRAIGHIPIPSFDLSNFAGGYLPPGIVLGIDQPTTSVQASYLVLEGAVVRAR